MGMLKSNNANRRSAGRWIATAIGLAVMVAGGSWTTVAQAQSGAKLSALTTFGVNGWLAPGQLPFNGADTERGIAYNPVTKNIVFTSRSGGSRVVILNGTTGLPLASGTLNVSTIVSSSATFAINKAGVSGDGRIFVCNLAGNSGTNQLFRIYQWTSETDTAAPTIAFQSVVPANSTTPVGSIRIGDAFAVFGSGTSAQFAAAGSSSGTTNSFRNTGSFMIGTLDGSNSNAFYRGMTNTGTGGFGISTNTNDYRVSLTYVSATSVIGTQGGGAKYTGFTAASGTQNNANASVLSTISSGTAPFNGSINSRLIGYKSLGGRDYLATMDVTTSVLSVYDITTAMTQTSGSNPVLVASLATQTGGVTGNTNGSGSIEWGETTQPSPESPWYLEARVYTLNTNNGIQAMIFSVPEPSTWAMLAAGAVTCGGAAVSRSRSRRRRSA